jgi:hypothetical protein
MIAALVADVGGFLLLLVGGTSGIWSSLAVFGFAASRPASDPVRSDRLSGLGDGPGRCRA